MNPITWILQLRAFQKEFPPFFFSYIPPLAYSIPNELIEEIKDIDPNYPQITISYIAIENFSNQLLKNIRIKLKTDLKYNPKVETNDHRGFINYTYSESYKEIIIPVLDPKEEVVIILYPPRTVSSKNFEPMVIINDVMVSKAMRLYGSVVRDPIILLTIFLTFSVIAFFSWQYFSQDIYINHERILLKDAVQRVAKNGTCQFKVVKVNGNTAEKYLNTQFQLSLSLEANKVSSEAQLLRKNKIVVCASKN